MEDEVDEGEVSKVRILESLRINIGEWVLFDFSHAMVVCYVQTTLQKCGVHLDQSIKTTLLIMEFYLSDRGVVELNVMFIVQCMLIRGCGQIW